MNRQYIDDYKLKTQEVWRFVNSENSNDDVSLVDEEEVKDGSLAMDQDVT